MAKKDQKDEPTPVSVSKDDEKDQSSPVTGDQPADKTDQPATDQQDVSPGERARQAADVPPADSPEAREQQAQVPTPKPTAEGDLPAPEAAGEGPASDVPVPIRDHFVSNPPTEAQAIVREQQREARDENFQSPPLDQSASMEALDPSGESEQEIEVQDIGGSIVIDTHGPARLDREAMLAFQKRIRRATQFVR